MPTIPLSVSIMPSTSIEMVWVIPAMMLIIMVPIRPIITHRPVVMVIILTGMHILVMILAVTLIMTVIMPIIIVMSLVMMRMVLMVVIMPVMILIRMTIILLT